MPFKLFDFPTFNYFRSRKDSNGITIFDSLDSQVRSNSLDQDVDKSMDKTEDNKSLCKTAPRDSMLKFPENRDIIPIEEWSLHPFVRPNFSTTTKTYEGPIGEWTVETRVGTFSGTSDQFSAEFFGSNFFGPDSGANFFESETEPNFFGPNLGSNLFGSGFSQDFFGSYSDSTNDHYSSNLETFPFSSTGPRAMFEQLFGMLQQFQFFADNLDPYKPLGPPRT